VPTRTQLIDALLGCEWSCTSLSYENEKYVACGTNMVPSILTRDVKVILGCCWVHAMTNLVRGQIGVAMLHGRAATKVVVTAQYGAPLLIDCVSQREQRQRFHRWHHA